ncbi:MAG: polymer-forming cytoskeletal protein [Lewinellaceae bacterium]|nr:polymer-forming cytoskeletal protein [Saprospiraceae bacterium]MCB9340241.1 polymer-forming cytoskeletal protein [Lewinellaceae bacterium]
MFGNSKQKDTGKSTTPAASSHSLNSLVQGTVLEGKVKSTNDIRIDGTIKGELYCDAKVIVGPTGAIEGIVKCQNAVIEGTFEGNLRVDELLNIRETAKVTGEVSYGKLVVQSGAIISGSYKVAGEQSNGSAKHSSDSHKIVSNSKTSDAQEIAGKAQHLSKEKVN